MIFILGWVFDLGFNLSYHTDLHIGFCNIVDDTSVHASKGQWI